MQTLARPSTAEAGQSVQQLPRERSPQVRALYRWLAVAKGTRSTVYRGVIG